MKDRIKQIRKEAGLNQTEFAESIGLSRGHIAQVETGNSLMSERTIRDICRIYKVNEEWLKTGTGDPRPQKTRNQEIAEFFNDAMEDNGFMNRFVYALTKLDIEDWEAIEKIIDKFIDENKKEG